MKKRVLVTIDPEIHRLGQELAQANGISFSAVVSMLVAQAARKMSRSPKREAGTVIGVSPAQAGGMTTRGSRSRRDESTPTPLKQTTGKAGRNDPCPCGSGRKFKKCCKSIQ